MSASDRNADHEQQPEKRIQNDSWGLMIVLSTYNNNILQLLFWSSTTVERNVFKHKAYMLIKHSKI